MAKQSNEKGKPCLPCYLRIQDSEEIDDGLVGVKLYEVSPENISKIHNDPNRYRLRSIPATLAEGTVIVGSSTYLNKYSQLVGIAKSLKGGPNFVDTRDNKIVIHDGKQSGKAVFAYTYAGGTGELLEFRIQTKYVQSIEVGQASSVNPDTKTIETDVVQCIPTNDDPCKPDAYVKENEPSILTAQRDATYMSKIGKSLMPRTMVCREIKRTTSEPTVYDSIDDAKQKISSNPSLTDAEIRAYNSQMKSEWDNYLKALKEAEDAIRSGKIDVGFPTPPYEVSFFTVPRTVRVKLDPIEYAPSNSKAHWQNRWRQGYNALKKRSDLSIIVQNPSEEKPYGDYPYEYPGSKLSKVTVEMELEIQIPGVRVVSDPRFATLGEFMVNDIIESVNSQIKSKAKFVGNPDMQSSQIIEIKNVGERYSGEWYAKEVEHSFNTGGYFTEVTFEKKSRNSILNKISTSVNMQEVFQKAHDIAKESYTTGAWKIPSKIISETLKYKASSWEEGEKENPRRAGRQIMVYQGSDPSDYTIFEAKTDFRVDRDISPK